MLIMVSVWVQAYTYDSVCYEIRCFFWCIRYRMFMVVAPDRTAADWLKAAARRLVAGGSEAVAVEPLAREMGVTKGSFYWHFRNRPALLEALVADWESRATAPLLERLKRLGGGPADRLAALMATVAAEGGGSLDPSMRAWAESDARASAAVGRVDAVRLAYIAGEFRALGFAASAAWTRARLFYLHLLGEHALALGSSDTSSEERLREARRVLALLTLPDEPRSD
jgi:AcrR family transcriptional regulator